MKNILTCISFIMTLFSFHLHGQNNISSGYIFSSITIEESLPHNFVDDIYRDSKGFLWISSQGGGLSRYDGYEFVTFNVSSLPIRLKSNFIRRTCEDNFNRLWVASDYGIDIIDLSTMQNTNMPVKNELFEKLLISPATHIIKDSDNCIWIMGSKDIFRLAFDSDGSISEIDHLNSKDKTLTAINEIDKEIWLGVDASICRLDTDKSGNLTLETLTGMFEPTPNAFIFSIIKKDDNIWIGTDYGLCKYNSTNKTQWLYTHDANNPESISQNMVTSLTFLNDSILVAGTLRGINLHNIKTTKFERIFHCSNAVSLTSDFVNCMLLDNNNFWIGTEAGGINKMTLRKLSIQNYIHNENDKTSISPNPVNAILEDHRGDLWVGTVEGGLNRKMRNSNEFIHYTVENSFLNHNSVSALEEDKDGNLWIGTWGGGVNILNLNLLPQISYRSYIPATDYIALLKYDPVNNGMWIGTNRNIYYYDIQSGAIKNPLPQDMTENINGVLGCLIDKNNILWIGCSKGLIQIDLNAFDKTNLKSSARFFSLNDTEVDNLFLKNITCLYQSKDNVLWLGSNGYGIIELIAGNNQYIYNSFTNEQGLGSNTIFGIAEDEQGMIWISTGRGISSYSPQSKRFVNYTKNDGLINDQFYWNASYKSPFSHNIYFGNMGGLTILEGNESTHIADKTKVVFTKLQILNQTIHQSDDKYITKDIAYTDLLDLHERDKSFTVEFSALDYDNPSTVAYSYRLNGFDDEWINVPSNRRFASYTNLPPGNYTLQVRSMSKGYDWSEDISELKIIIQPYFYKTGWFIGLFLLLVIFIVTRLYKWRVRSLKKQREILHKKVEERTSELEKRKKQLEEQANELTIQNNTLVVQNEKISSQRKQLMELSTQVQEAMTNKISFFTNITHEFRTPLTLIIGPVEKALKISTNPKVIEQLQYAVRNARHLLSLVNQLMDFRKVESDRIDILPVTGDFLDYLDELLIPFESFAQEREIEIRKIYRLNHPTILFDKEAMRKIITNLLSNAIKFTPNKGVISVYAGSFTEITSGQEKLYLCVSDSGNGVKEDDINKIFERFFQSREDIRYPVYGQSGTGIGLYLCKKIVDLQDGDICVKNNRTRGASFRIVLPLLRDNTSILLSQKGGDSIPLQIKNTDINADIEYNKKICILVVEDNTDMRKYICSILKDYYQVMEAENGVEALAILKTEIIDFIISDLMMPIMDGLELSEKVKADFSISHIPFLILTAKTSLETQINSYKIGVDEFLTKPFDEELLLARIQNILDTRSNYQRRFSRYMDINELNIAEESADEKFLRKALEVLKKNYKNTEYKVSDFITDMGVNKSLLNTKMQTLTGYSSGNFIRNFRLNLAKELILSTKGNKNISEIAYEVGFNDPKYFTRCFTKHFGIPPSNMIKD